MAKTSEPDLGLAVMKVLATETGNSASVRTLVKRASEYIKLTDEDRIPSTTRPNELVWEQRVRNLKSHDKTEGNVIKDGFVRHTGRGRYKLTDSGILHLRNKGIID